MNCTPYFFVKWLDFIFSSIPIRRMVPWQKGINDSPTWNLGKCSRS